MRTAYIYDAIRTPRARANSAGGFRGLKPHALLATLYRALEQRTGLEPAKVEDIVLGCVTQYGEQAANIAKTSSLFAGWPGQVPGITVQRYCSSGADAINIGAMKVMTGICDLVVAGGVEMMSRVPMMSDQPTAFLDSKEAKKLGMYMMGSGADLIASLYNLSRGQVDQVALQSQQRAQYAREQGYFSSIIPVKNTEIGDTIKEDECIRSDTTVASLAALKPAFAELGQSGVNDSYLRQFSELSEIHHMHTAGNSPAMADAAATLLIGSQRAGDALSVKPRARITAMGHCNDDPHLVVSGCVAATKKLLQESELTVSDVDLFEIHEAFAATIIKCQQDLSIPVEKLNVNGGCIALGHPLGATGAIMAGVLLDELERRDLKRGLVALSGAAGAGTALLIERS